MTVRHAVVWCAFEVEKDDLKEEELAELTAYLLSTIAELAAKSKKKLPVTFKGCKARIAKPGEQLDPLSVLNNDDEAG